MANYKSDRRFTDYVHSFLAIPLIYQALRWQQEEIPDDILESLDMNKGIDYVFRDENNLKITIQERFREARYSCYNDFTLRYQRPYNRDVSKHKSEFFKIDADYLVYGIVDGYKNDFPSVKSFIKYAIIDLSNLFVRIDNEEIVLDSAINETQIINGKFVCPINTNRDYSSTFVAFDIRLLISHFPPDKIVVKQVGFY